MKSIRRLLIAALLWLPKPAGANEAWVGVYLWGGMLTSESAAEGPGRFHDSVKHLLEAGFDSLRVAVGPQAVTQYGLPTSAYCRPQPSMGCFMRIMLNSPAWDNPALRRLMITAQDFTCDKAAGRSNGCLSIELLNKNKNQIKKETVDLLEVLYQRLQRKDIQFILSNWEGDNYVYCGASYAFATKRNFPERCRAHFRPGQSNRQRIQAFLRWMEIRDEAVAEFREQHPGADIIHAPEINAVRMFDSGCGGSCDAKTDTILSQMAATGGRDYCSYSIYDSQGPNLGRSITEILRTCRNLILGEFGLDSRRSDERRIRTNFQAINQIRSERGLYGVVVWNGYDPLSGEQNFGLFRPNGAPHQIDLMGALKPNPSKK